MIDLAGKKIILASQSPRRKELLANLDIPFEVRVKGTDESFPSELPVEDVAYFLAKKKAMAFMEELEEDTLLITADTVVIVRGKVLNKPRNREEALEMLRLLSGTSHQVCTGVAFAYQGKVYADIDAAQVYFRTLEQAEMEYYVDRYRPYDKAGAYGIQEWIGYVGVEKIEGSFYTVMGLPVHLVYRWVRRLIVSHR
ncbi:Maf family nucleotide pyrophosphatase [Mongoliitalea daihaiensis]|uniref:Maf family nucleotide pyrophosphatase n=1 Tax=Mongoliitalea daihaiensis TaxID=2782006 RepID=UPI001F422C28|nr:Maf family nucleotide pyrophosphatase [Mongoliitalea daihaiensis]UJP64753.1 septum formation protein Maf [Mongoliitalea daihaiensis]